MQPAERQRDLTSTGNARRQAADGSTAGFYRGDPVHDGSGRRGSVGAVERRPSDTQFVVLAILRGAVDQQLELLRERELAGGSAEQARQAGAIGATASGAPEEAESLAGTVRQVATAAKKRGRSHHCTTGAARSPQEDRLREQSPGEDGSRFERRELWIPHQSQYQAADGVARDHQQRPKSNDQDRDHQRTDIPDDLRGNDDDYDDDRQPDRPR